MPKPVIPPLDMLVVVRPVGAYPLPDCWYPDPPEKPWMRPPIELDVVCGAEVLKMASSASWDHTRRGRGVNRQAIAFLPP